MSMKKLDHGRVTLLSTSRGHAKLAFLKKRARALNVRFLKRSTFCLKFVSLFKSQYEVVNGYRISKDFLTTLAKCARLP